MSTTIESAPARAPRIHIPLPNAPYLDRLACLLMNYLHQDLKPLPEWEKTIFKMPDCQDKIYSEVILADSNEMKAVDLPALPDFHHVAFTVDINKLLTQDGMAVRYELRLSATCEDEYNHPLSIGDDEYEPNKLARDVTIVLYKVMDVSTNAHFLDLMDWDDLLKLLRKYVLRTYDEFGRKRSFSEAVEVEGTWSSISGG
ncbi:hypothetical protein ONS95_000312 [Cadophora gregata]|uniref:uncharacterized protein n=1 Tax=Cadophora gregata TaxID=51156 RepID=UPI0026DC4692|nr:uncharacterized protein ONS95_000312 [Cadophora gregata]KAK0125685.1 hypothetical protein ONS96_009518 [Cadophora gregata f. sp. sojae]KAK0128337.1 hypothetical protein ONS95_000312 [Cadophora gregata]